MYTRVISLRCILHVFSVIRFLMKNCQEIKPYTRHLLFIHSRGYPHVSAYNFSRDGSQEVPEVCKSRFRYICVN